MYKSVIVEPVAAYNANISVNKFTKMVKINKINNQNSIIFNLKEIQLNKRIILNGFLI